MDFITLFLLILRRLYNNTYTEERLFLGKATWPCNSDIRLDEVVTNDVKMGYIPTETWPTPQKMKQTRFDIHSRGPI